MKAELIFYNGAKLLEGPCWDGRKGRLYFVAIRQNTIFCLEPETGRVYSYSTEGAVGAAVADEGFTLLEAEKSGIYRLDLATGKKQPFAHVFSDPVMRYNDGKLDPKGRFLVDVMGDQERNSRGGLFAVERDGSFRQLIGGTTVANGLGFSPNGETLYFIDTPTKKVMAYAYSAESGTLLSEGRAIVELTGAGSPDGMCVDAAGQLWVAEYGGGRVGCWNPENGQKEAEVLLPCRNVTSCCIGGERADTLYITTAQCQGEENAPLAGGLFQAKIS